MISKVGPALLDLEAASNADLVALCLRNEPGAWRTLVSRHASLVYSIARRSGLSEDDSSDVVQTVFLSLLEHLPQLRQPEQVSAWISTTAKRAAWRMAARPAPLYGTAAAQDESDLDLAPDERALESEERQQIAAAFRLLDDRARRLLWLLFCDPRQPSYDIIASELRIPKGSIGPLRARALAKLKGLYEQVAGRPSKR